MKTLHQFGVFAVFLFTVGLLTYATWAPAFRKAGQQETAVRMEKSMTDLRNWPSLIRWKTDKDGIRYAMLPFSVYQLGNILGLMKRVRGLENEDWYNELLALAADAMKRLDIKELHNAWGDRFTLNNIENWRHNKGETSKQKRDS